MDNPETSRDVPAIGQNESTDPPPAEPAPPAAQVKIDDTNIAANYANFCRLTGTPEELLIDFGLNPQAAAITTQPVVVTERVVTGWYTAKRLLQVLQMTVARHEAVFGVLETDMQKRIRRT